MLKKISELTLDTVIDHNDVVPINNGGTTKKTFGLNLKNDLFTQFSNTGAIRDGMNSGDPYINNVSLLLHGDGANNAQNNTFLDSSANNFTITRNGTPTQGSFSPFNENWSNYFPGVNGNYLSVPSNAAFNFASGTFTVEAWVMFTSVAATYQTIITNYNSTTTGWYLQTYLNKFIVSFSGDVPDITGTTTIVPNVWYHVAVSGSAGSYKLFVNGTQEGATYTGATSLAGGNLGIGAVGDRSGYIGTSPISGYISNVRIVNGTALYTSNFTPPTSNLTAVAGTSLLTCQSNRFVDNSSNNFTITVNGTPSVSLESPFKSTSVYSPSVNGGSGYFNGTTDYLDCGTAVLNTTGDFTIECWIYVTGGSGTYRNIIGQYIYATPNRTNFGIATDNKLSWSTIGSTTELQSVNIIPTNVWTHVSIVRNGSGTNNVSMYVNGIVQGSYTDTDNFAQTNTWIGQGQTFSNGLFVGYISNLRITNTAVYTSNFTPPTSPVTAVANTALLCNFTNAGIFDSAKKNNLVTAGDAKVSNAVTKFGSGAMYFDGTGDVLYAPHSNNLVFGSSDFTIETWVYHTDISGTYRTIFSKRPSTTAAGGGYKGIVFGLYNGNYDIYITFNGSTWAINPGNITPAVLNTWEHIALVRSGSTFTFYKNGVNLYSATNSGTIFDDTASRATIGADSEATAYYMNGYLDDFRITKGVARYTSNFTPPTRAFPDDASGIGTDLTGTYKWLGGVLAPNGKIYGIPSGSTSVLAVDPATNTASTFGSLTTGIEKWFGGSLAPNGKIYGIPYSSTSVLIIDPDTNTTSTFGNLTGNLKWAGGVLAPNGKIYGIPYDSTSILVIDPTTNTVSTFGNLTGTNKWVGGVLAPDGKIYGIAYSSTSVLIIDPATNTTSTFGSLTGTIKWTGGVLASNGKIYGIPYGSTSVLIIDPATNTTSTFASTRYYLGGVLAPNGKIYGIPQTSSSVLVIDPVTNTTSTFGSLTGDLDKWWGGTLAPNGKIYGIPASSTDVLQITPGLNTSSPNLPLDRCISAYYNKF